MKTSSTPCRGWVAVRLLPSLWLVPGAAQPAAAPRWLSLAQRGDGDLNGSCLNPSALADSRLTTHPSLGAAEASFSTTYLRLALPRKPLETGSFYTQDRLTLEAGAGHGLALTYARLPPTLPTAARAASR